jgi:hypothetical protein
MTWLVLFLLSAGCIDKGLHGDADNGGLFVPDGFEALVVADSCGPARHLAVNANGDVYVKLRINKGDSGNVAMRDVDGDGRADETELAGYLASLGGVRVVVEPLAVRLWNAADTSRDNGVDVMEARLAADQFGKLQLYSGGGETVSARG